MLLIGNSDFHVTRRNYESEQEDRLAVGEGVGRPIAKPGLVWGVP